MFFLSLQVLDETQSTQRSTSSGGQTCWQTAAREKIRLSKTADVKSMPGKSLIFQINIFSGCAETLTAMTAGWGEVGRQRRRSRGRGGGGGGRER